MNSMFIRLIYIILNVPLSSQLLPDPQDPPAFPKAPSLCWPPLPSDPSRKWRINLRPSNLSSQPITQPSVQRIRCPTGSLTPHTTSSRPSRCLFFFFFFRLLQKLWPNSIRDWSVKICIPQLSDLWNHKFNTCSVSELPNCPISPP